MATHTDLYVYAYLRAKDSDHGPQGSPYYIGKGRLRRRFDRKHTVPPPKDPNRNVILAQDMTDPDAMQAEMLLIFLYGRLDRGTGILCNLSDGGEGPTGRIVSAENRLAVGNANRTRVLTEEDHRHISQSHLGRKHTPEAKEKIRQANKGLPRSPERIAKWRESKIKNAKPISDETKAKLRLARLGWKHSEETKAKILAGGRRFRENQIKDRVRLQDKEVAGCPNPTSKRGSPIWRTYWSRPSLKDCMNGVPT